MRILLVPHVSATTDGWAGSRQQRMVRHLGDDDIAVVAWEQNRRLANIPRWGSVRRAAPLPETDEVFEGVLPPNLYRAVTREYPKDGYLRLARRCFNAVVSRAVEEFRPDVAWVAASHHFTGFPSLPAALPVVFDYVDLSPDWVEERYMAMSDSALAVSPALVERLERSGKPVALVPNGVELSRVADLDRAEAKRRLGYGDTPVISLIGLTCSPTLYFLDSLKRLQDEGRRFITLIVGGDPLADDIRDKAAAIGLEDVRLPGAVDPDEVHVYFAASDVGLYPGEDNTYYRESAPLKIIEYTAARAQVVSSPVDAYAGWSSIRFRQPEIGAWTDAIRDALDDPAPIQDVSSYDWRRLAADTREALESAAEAAGSRFVASSRA